MHLRRGPGWAAPKLQPAAKLRRERADQPLTQLRTLSPGLLHANPIVGYDKAEVIARSEKPHADGPAALLRKGVLQRVRQELVDDQPDRHRTVHRKRVALGFHFDLNRPDAHEGGSQVITKAGDELRRVRDGLEAVPCQPLVN